MEMIVKRFSDVSNHLTPYMAIKCYWSPHCLSCNSVFYLICNVVIYHFEKLGCSNGLVYSYIAEILGQV